MPPTDTSTDTFINTPTDAPLAAVPGTAPETAVETGPHAGPESVPEPDAVDPLTRRTEMSNWIVLSVIILSFVAIVLSKL